MLDRPNSEIGNYAIIGIGILLLLLSFGHNYTGELFEASTLAISPSESTVEPGSTIVLNYEFVSSWGTREWSFELTGSGQNQETPRVTLAYGQPYHNSFRFSAPTTEGTYTYKIIAYFHVPGHIPTKAERETIQITVKKTEPESHTLTVIVQDSNGNPVSNAEVSINSGAIGYTDASGMISKSDLTGSYTVLATKEGYTSDTKSVSMTSDITTTLTLTQSAPVEEGTPSPTPVDEPIEDDIPLPDVLPPTKYTIVFEFLDEGNPVDSVKTVINGNTMFSNPEGKVSIRIDPGTSVQVVATKEGYNRFEKTYTGLTDTLIKINMAASTSGNFLNFDVSEDNPFYDPNGLFGIVPYWLAIGSTIIIIAGIFRLRASR